MIKMHNGLYRYTEDALRDHNVNVERLAVLKDYLAASYGAEADMRVQGGEFVPEQDRVLDRQAWSYEYQALHTKVDAVRRFIGTLNAVEAAFVRLRYFERKQWKVVAAEMHISEQAAKYRWAPKIIYRAAKILFGYRVQV